MPDLLTSANKSGFFISFFVLLKIISNLSSVIFAFIRHGMSKWIDDSIIIDFPIPNPIQQIISELEKYDQEEDDYFYFDRSELLENLTKDYVYEEVLTAKQRELLIQKYS